jgi:uncharacterized protein YlzI (FlbEa/FlbD family)
MNTISCAELFANYKKALIGTIECDYDRGVCVYGNTQCYVTRENVDFVMDKISKELVATNTNKLYLSKAPKYVPVTYDFSNVDFSKLDKFIENKVLPKR